MKAVYHWHCIAIMTNKIIVYAHYVDTEKTYSHAIAQFVDASLSPEGPGSIPGQSMWDLWWTRWHWNKSFCKYFSFPLLALFSTASYSFIDLSVCLPN
jgi:hypothetical protein